MTTRQFRILATLVNAYVEDGEPVSSGWVAEHCALGLSPATVRSILAGLEEQGLVRQPHTSAGRIPTDLGYRLYVDSLLESRRRARPASDVEARLRRSGTVSDLLETASQELSRASHQIGFALAPANAGARLQHLDFVPLDGTRVLVIIVAVGGVITQKVIDTEERYSSTTLSQAANYVNSEFAGRTLHEVREAILQRLREERQLYDELVRRALTLARSGLDQVEPPELLYVQGASYLVDGLAGDGEDRQRTLETLRLLLHMIEEKHQLVDLLTRSIDAGGITVVIGSEHRSPDLRPFSLVASTFQDGDRLGTVGVIGPTRMRYQRAISVVDVISRAVERVLEGP
ncbi:MAG: heat-inducible transcription repressor HrcA [Acidobacteria bacterium]|nr:heat-inducible transcription repressor HrcA [Acidobacteriota bacterium]